MNYRHGSMIVAMLGVVLLTAPAASAERVTFTGEGQVLLPQELLDIMAADRESLRVKGELLLDDSGAFLGATLYAADAHIDIMRERDGSTVMEISTQDELLTFELAKVSIFRGASDVSVEGLVGAHLFEITLHDAGRFMAENPQPEATVLPGKDIGVSRIGLNSSGCGDDFHYWGSSSGIRAFSMATTSCNYGTQTAEWLSGSSGRHPLISQNVYRLNNDRFEHIGQSWLKHSFCAVSENTCGPCSSTNCDSLGIGCADTYWATLNDGQDGGAKSDINPQGLGTTGGNSNTHSHPYTTPSGSSAIRGRLQIKETDINMGGQFFAEAHYITHDEPLANRHNNASWREINLGLTSMSSVFSCQSSVQDREAAIQAWADFSGATIVNVDVPTEGRFHLGYLVTDNGDGTWHYEYALHNMNSHRCAGGFTVPIASGVTLSSIGFHDVDYHSGEPYANTDWTATQLGDDSLNWATVPFATDANANALRWGTLYNFRFDASTPPQMGSVTIDLFKPGTPDSLVVANISIPSEGGCIMLSDCADVNEDHVRDDACTYWECDAGNCVATAIGFADMGGSNGDCFPDGTADGNDRFMALNCFSDVDTFGLPKFHCEDTAPNVYNVDAGGEFGSCSPDGVCDGHDAFHAINTFEGNSICSCSGPAPSVPTIVTEQASLALRASAKRVRAGHAVAVDVMLNSPLADLRGYQLHVEASGGSQGSLVLSDILVQERDDAAFGSAAGAWNAFNTATGQMVSGLDSIGQATGSRAYLATFVFEATADAAGRFVVDVRHGGGPQDRSFLFPTDANGRIEIVAATPAVIDVARARRGR